MILPPLPDLDRPPVRREILPNGVVVHVENRPGHRVVACLTFSTDGVDPDDRRIGLPHLAEHLLMRTAGPEVDPLLESKGGYSYARTTRDAVQIVVATPEGAGEAIAALVKLTRIGAVTREVIEREARIIGFEGETRSPESPIVDRLRRDLIPDDGEAFGRPDAWLKVEPGRVAATGLAILKGRAALTVVGPCDPDGTLALGAERLALFASLKGRPPVVRAGRRAERDGAIGRTVAGVENPRGLAALAAAFGWAGSWVSFEPRVGGVAIAMGTEGAARPTVNEARARLAEWHRTRLADPETAAITRGLWAVARPGLNFDRLLTEARPDDRTIAEEIDAWSP